MEKPTSGDIFFEGENITQANEHEMNKLRQRMGMVFQHFNLFPHLTIKKNITLAPVKLGLMTADEADKRRRSFWKELVCLIRLTSILQGSQAVRSRE